MKFDEGAMALTSDYGIAQSFAAGEAQFMEGEPVQALWIVFDVGDGWGQPIVLMPSMARRIRDYFNEKVTE